LITLSQIANRVTVIESSIQSCVDSNIKPLIETVKRQQITINEQQEVIDGHSKQLTEQSDKTVLVRASMTLSVTFFLCTGGLVVF
jgi:hypothetical protein